MDKESKLPPDKKLSDRWTELNAKKTNLINRCQDYAMWTLPYLFPRTGTQDSELQGPLDSTGARAVNHLSNKLIMALFAPSQPFFRLTISDEIAEELAAKAKDGDEQALTLIAAMDEALAKTEKSAMKELNFNRYRTEATTAAKSLIVTGNAMLYHPKNGPVQMYGLRDYCVCRDLSGNVVEILTMEKKNLHTFKKEIREKLEAYNKGKYSSQKEVCIYTQVILEDDMKYHMYQYADDMKLEESSATWTAEDLPYLVLTWNLVRGEDYGRGLVEDYAGAFHALYQLAQAEIDVVAIAADIKFLVDPGSSADVETLNASESGTYHSGREGDVTVLQINKAVDMQMVEGMVQRLQQQIGAAFMLQSAVTRDAERVTAEEVRQVANELDLSNGGIYSRFAEEWQYRTAILMLNRINVNLGDKTIDPVIITGLDSLSRAGDIDNLRLLISDLAALNEVPEDVRAGIDPAKFIAYCAVRRGVDYQKFEKSPAKIQAENQQMQQQVQMQQEGEAQVGIAQEAARAAFKQPGE
jgi:hypothetical protein